MSDLDTLIAQGNALEKPGTEEQAIAYFVQLANDYPDHAVVQYELGGAFGAYVAELRDEVEKS